MKVKFSLPIRGIMSFEHDTPLEFGDWSFDFQRSQTSNNIERLNIIVSNIPKENWPFVVKTTRKVGKDGVPVFPFQTQPNAFGFSKINDQIERLEGILSLFGVYEFDFNSFSEEWVQDPEDELSGGISSWKSSPRPPDPSIISEIQLSNLIPAAEVNNLQIYSLAHFRLAQAASHKGNHIEAVRHCYLFFEELFANGNSKSKQTIKEFMSSVLFTENCQNWMSKEKVKYDNLRSKRSSWFEGDSEIKRFFTYLTKLRGHLQHAKKAKSKLAWSPHRQDEYAQDAHCLLNIAFQIHGILSKAQ